MGEVNRNVAVRVIVRGLVQGVFFRASTETRAKALGLTGYVTNRADGRSVEVVAEGAKEDLDTLLSYLKVGPPRSRVEEVSAEWTPGTGGYSNFSVK